MKRFLTKGRVLTLLAILVVLVGSGIGLQLFFGDSERAYEDLIPDPSNRLWSLPVITSLLFAITFALIDRVTVVDKEVMKEIDRRQREKEQRKNAQHYGYALEETKPVAPEPEQPITAAKVTIRTSVWTAVYAFIGMLMFNMVHAYFDLPIFLGFGAFGSGFGIFGYGFGIVLFLVMNLVIATILFALRGAVKKRLSMAPITSLGLVVILLLGHFVFNIWWIGEGNAKKLAALANVTIIKAQGDNTVYPPTNEQMIPAFGPQEARFKAERAMNDGGLGTLYDLGSCVEQAVKGKRVYVCELLLTERRTTQTADFTVPGYITVDAHDKDAIGRFVSKTDDGSEIQINYWPGGWWDANLERLVWKTYPNRYPDNYTIEIDDNGTAFYTATLNKPVVRFEKAIPETFITINAQTGVITPYALSQIPSWVDRVYGEETVRYMMDVWGRWGQAPFDYFKQSTENRYKVNGGLNLVFTDQGMAWQVLLGSWRKEDSIQYIALFNTRGGSVRVYPAPKGLCTEQTAIEQFQKSGKNIKSLDPTNLGLYRIYGELVWIGTLVPNGSGGVMDGNYPKAESYNGTGALRALKPDAANVILGSSHTDTFDQLSVQIATLPLSSTPNPDASVKEVTGTIDRINIFNDTSGPILVLKLKGDDHAYQGRITYDQARNFVLLAADDEVKITFLDTGKPERAIATVTLVPSSSVSK